MCFLVCYVVMWLYMRKVHSLSPCDLQVNQWGVQNRSFCAQGHEQRNRAHLRLQLPFLQHGGTGDRRDAHVEMFPVVWQASPRCRLSFTVTHFCSRPASNPCRPFDIAVVFPRSKPVSVAQRVAEASSAGKANASTDCLARRRVLGDWVDSRRNGNPNTNLKNE